MNVSQAGATVPTEDVLSHLMDSLKSNEVEVHEMPTHFDLIHWLDYIPRLHADALGLYGVVALYMHIRLPSPSSFGGQHRPIVEISVGSKVSESSKKKTQPYDKAVYQVSKICEAYIANHWPCKNKRDTTAFLKQLYRHVQAKIPQLGNFCVVCGLEQKEKNGLKPVPCDSEACNFAYDELGIGAGLTDLYNRPKIADLLITMASAACQCTNRRDQLFKCLPTDLLITKKEESKTEESKPLIIKKKNGKPLISKKTSKTSKTKQSRRETDWDRMLAAFQGLPSVATMAKKPDLQQFFFNKEFESQSESETEQDPESDLHAPEHMDLTDGLLQFRLLRSILNSCRGHLMELDKADRFEEMATEHQFRLCTDSPAKEAAFAAMKTKKGSCFMFHGSAFPNWHCILREGLKNMSNTSMMSAGAAHGSGIYLAENSGTSAGYCANFRYGYATNDAAFANSIYGSSPQCIALCEVINGSENKETKRHGVIIHPFDISVVPKADNVITRYLFVYPGTPIPHVSASSLGNICEKHAKSQEEHIKAVKKAIPKPSSDSLGAKTPASLPSKTTAKKRKGTRKALPPKRAKLQTTSRSKTITRKQTELKKEDDDKDLLEQVLSEYEFEYSYTDSD